MRRRLRGKGKGKGNEKAESPDDLSHVVHRSLSDAICVRLRGSAATGAGVTPGCASLQIDPDTQAEGLHRVLEELVRRRTAVVPLDEDPRRPSDAVDDDPEVGGLIRSANPAPAWTRGRPPRSTRRACCRDRARTPIRCRPGGATARARITSIVGRHRSRHRHATAATIARRRHAQFLAGVVDAARDRFASDTHRRCATRRAAWRTSTPAGCSRRWSPSAR